MNESEKLAAVFLGHQGYKDIVHHPDGQHRPPDFLVDQRIAVEVRRLNRNYEGEKGRVGFETDLIGLRNRIRELALSFGPPTQGQSWFVMLEFRRPVPPWRSVRRKLRQILQGFMDGSHAETRVPLGNGLELKLFPADGIHKSFFVPGPADDGVAGSYWLIPELERNLRICVCEKIDKIVPYKSKYPEWWLVLDDRIAYGLDASDRDEFREAVRLPDHPFDRIVLISPLDQRRAFQIAPGLS